MNAIAIESSGTHLSYAILVKNKLAVRFSADSKWQHEQAFWSKFPKDLKRAGLNLGQVNFLATTRGPGRFTGVRLGLAIVNTWATLYRVPVFAPTVHELMAWQYAHSPLAPDPSPLFCLVAFSGAFTAAYIKENSPVSIKSYPSLEDIFKKPKAGAILYYCQKNLEAAAKTLAAHCGPSSIKRQMPTGGALIQFGIETRQKGKNWFKPPRLAQPLYLKENWG